MTKRDRIKVDFIKAFFDLIKPQKYNDRDLNRGVTNECKYDSNQKISL